jgi:hypothetical protein
MEITQTSPNWAEGGGLCETLQRPATQDAVRTAGFTQEDHDGMPDAVPPMLPAKLPSTAARASIVSFGGALRNSLPQ